MYLGKTASKERGSGYNSEEYMKRTFIYTDEKSNKFWSIDADGSAFTVNYGKVGSAGQTQEKSFADEKTCEKEANKLIAEKTKKGYIEQESEEDDDE
jgi:predicted DNA-binding WGR domain protein